MLIHLISFSCFEICFLAEKFSFVIHSICLRVTDERLDAARAVHVEYVTGFTQSVPSTVHEDRTSCWTSGQ